MIEQEWVCSAHILSRAIPVYQVFISSRARQTRIDREAAQRTTKFAGTGCMIPELACAWRDGFFCLIRQLRRLSPHWKGSALYIPFSNLALTPMLKP
jgi:hypothetical protein